MNDKNTQPIANPVVVLREEFDDWAVLFNPDTAEAVGINPIGVFIWKLLDGTRTGNEIESEIRSSFADVPEAVATDVNGFIDDLATRGFVGINRRND